MTSNGKLYSCSCGCFKFYKGYAHIRCALCGVIQPGILYTDYVPSEPTILCCNRFISKETSDD